MSAYVCSSDHINAMITFGASGAHSGSYSYNESARIDFKGNEQASAAILYTANVESVNERYGDAEDSTGFVFRPYRGAKLSPVAILKLCDCFDYQACEVKAYRYTIAAQVIDGIRSHAIGMLPGYESAPWGID